MKDVTIVVNGTQKTVQKDESDFPRDQRQEERQATGFRKAGCAGRSTGVGEEE
jgi:hypothetical protein